MTRCPSCGFELDPQATSRCPCCGRRIAAPVGDSLFAPQFHTYPPQPSPIAWTAPTDERPLLESSEAAATATTTLPAPTATGYAGGYPIAADSPSPDYPRPPLAPLLERRRRKGLVVGIVAAVVAVLAACTWGTVVTVQAIHPPRQSAGPRPTPIIVYDNTFTSQDNGWRDDNEHCFLKGDGYHIAFNYMCFAPIGNLTDVDVRVQVKQVSGSLRYPMGIVFRLTENNSAQYKYYSFEITSNGYWELFKCNIDACDRLVNFRPSSAIHKGLGEDNLLEVYVRGSHIDLFINTIAVGSVDDTAYSFGKVGLLCGEFIECVFTNLLVGEVD